MQQFRESRFRSISPLQKAPVRYFGKDLTNISRRASPIQRVNNIQNKNRIHGQKQPHGFKYGQNHNIGQAQMKSPNQSNIPSKQVLVARRNRTQRSNHSGHHFDKMNYFTRGKVSRSPTPSIAVSPQGSAISIHKQFHSHVRNQSSQLSKLRGSKLERPDMYSQIKNQSQARSRNLNHGMKNNTQLSLNKSQIGRKSSNQAMTFGAQNLNKLGRQYGVLQRQNPSNQVKQFEDSPQRKVIKVADSRVLRGSSMIAGMNQYQQQNVSRSFTQKVKGQGQGQQANRALRVSYGQNKRSQNNLSLNKLTSSQILRSSQNKFYAKKNTTGQTRNESNKLKLTNSYLQTSQASLYNSYTSFNAVPKVNYFNQQPQKSQSKVRNFNSKPQSSQNIRISQFQPYVQNGQGSRVVSPNVSRPRVESGRNSISPIQSLRTSQNFNFKQFKNIHITHKVKNQLTEKENYNPFGQSAKNAAKIHLRKSTSNLEKVNGTNQNTDLTQVEATSRKIENFGNSRLEQNASNDQSGLVRAGQREGRLKVPLLKKPSLEVSQFNPFTSSSVEKVQNFNDLQTNDAEKQKDITIKLKERLKRINFQSQLRSSTNFQQENNLQSEGETSLKHSLVIAAQNLQNSQKLVRLNKIKKGDTSQIQKISEPTLTFHTNGNGGESNREFTFKANQLKSVLSKNQKCFEEAVVQENRISRGDQERLSKRYGRKKSKKSFSIQNQPLMKPVSELPSFKLPQTTVHSNTRMPHSFKKYGIDRRSPAYTFLPVQVSALAPGTSPSANLPVRNIWHDLVTKNVSYLSQS